MADDVFRLGLDGGMFLQHGGLGRREDAIEPAQDGERQDDLAVFVPLVGAAEQIADAPDESGDLGVRFGGHLLIPVRFLLGFKFLNSLGLSRLANGITGNLFT